MMAHRRLVSLAVVQGVLLVVVASLAAWFGRDEFHLWREQPPAAEDAAPAQDDANATPSVRLSAAAQSNAGLKTAAPVEADRAATGTAVELLVLDLQPLAEGRARLQALAQELEAARSQALASASEWKRVQGLFDDNRSASQRALEAARAQAAADASRVAAAQAALEAQRATAQLAWGRTVAGWLEAPKAAPLDRLLTARAALLRAAIAAGQTHAPGTLRLDAGGHATLLAGSATGARLYMAEPATLAPGQRVMAHVADRSTPIQGAWVPAGAVVWHAGQAWVYVQRHGDDDHDETSAAGANPASAPAAAHPANAAPAPARDVFERRSIAGAERVDDRWFVPGLHDEDAVVVQGAQVLLSEELKFQLRNENDD